MTKYSDNSFEDPLYIQSQVTKYLNTQDLELDKLNKWGEYYDANW